MAAGGINADGYIRCCKALHLVVYQSIPCVDDALKRWHATQPFPSCSRPRPRPPSNPQECRDSGKPKPSSSCSNCVAWGNAVENVYYPQWATGSMPWKNINPLCLHGSHIEVAKAFTFQLQSDKTYIILEHFDSGSLLKIMMHFGEFHCRNQNHVDVIKKISGARNKLCHMQLEDNLYLDTQQVDDIFSDIDDLISCLEVLHPQWFTTQFATDIRIQLSQIKTGPVTAEIERILEDFTKSVEEVSCQSIKKVQTDIKKTETVLLQEVPTRVKDQLVNEFENLNITAQQRSDNLHQTIQDGQRELKQDQRAYSQELTHKVDEIPIAVCEHLDTKLTQLDAHTNQLSQDIQQAFQEGQRELKLDQMISRQLLEQDISKVPILVQRELDPKFEQVHKDIQDEHQELRQAMTQKHEDLSQQMRGVKETLQSDQYKRPPNFDIDACRRNLMAEYRETRSKLTLLPGMPEECADMDDLYIELDLLEEEKTPTEIKIKRTLKSADELFTLRNKRGRVLKRILVRGGPGSGKSCTISKLAYDWANEKVIPDLPNKLDLLFALDLREIQKGMNLIDAIQDQLLPKCSKSELMSYVETHSKSVVFLLDGFDEASDVPQFGDIKHLLSSKWLQESLVIVTTRQNKVAEFVDTYGSFSHIQLTGFSKEHIKEYVLRFLQVESYSQFIESDHMYEYTYAYDAPEDMLEEIFDIVSLLNDLISSFQGLCQTPLTLSMLCLMWSDDKQVLTQKITDIYDGAFKHLAKHKQAKYKNSILNNDCLQQQQLKTILIEIGRTALNGLFQDRLIFQSGEFDELTLKNACYLGFLTTERKRSKASVIEHISFFHKTYQEYCAAMYWSDLVKNDRQMFMSYLQQISANNVTDMKILLQFCCGSSLEAADIILPHIVRLSCDMERLDPLSYHGSLILSRGNFHLDTPLLLLYESGAQLLHTHLFPLFDIQSLYEKSSIEINSRSLGMAFYCPLRNTMKSKTFIFFLESVLQNTASIHCMFKGVTEAVIHLDASDKSSGVTYHYLKLLSCILELQSLVIQYNSIDNLGMFLNALVAFDMPSKVLISSLAIESNNRYSVLSIPSHTIQQLVIFMNQLNSLNTLRFHDVSVCDIQCILKALDCKLTKLTISDCYISSELLNETLSPLLPSLHALHLPGGCTDFFGVLVEVGRQLRLNKATANVSPNALEDNEQDMQRPVYLPCKQLILDGGTCITKDVAKKLVEAFDYLGNLQELCLPYANITDGVGAMIGKDLYKLSHLMILDLSGNQLGDWFSSYWDVIGDSTENNQLCDDLKVLTKLRHLNMHSTWLNQRRIIQLASSLIHMPDLQVLNLGLNKIGTHMKDLAHSLQHLTKLEQLHLSGTGLKSKDISCIASSLTRMPDLQILDLGCNIIGSAMGDLCHGLQHLIKLQVLILSHIALTDDDVAMLPLEHLTNLKELHIECYEDSVFNQKYGPDGVEYLFTKLPHMSHLNRLLVVHYYKIWHKSNEFLRECWQALSMWKWLDDDCQCLSLKKHGILSIVKFVEKYEQRSLMS